MQSFIFLSLPKCLSVTLLLLKLDSIFISKVSTMLNSTTYLCASIPPLLLLFICNVNAFGLRMKWTSSVIHRLTGGISRLTRALVGHILKFYEGAPVGRPKQAPVGQMFMNVRPCWPKFQIRVVSSMHVGANASLSSSNI